MKLSETETNFAILRFKTRIFSSFIFSIISTIVFIVIAIILWSDGMHDLFWMMITLSVFTTFVAIGLGIYIFRIRGE